MKKHIAICLLLFTACRTKPADVVHISVSKNTVQVTGLPQMTLNGIQRDSMPVQAWQSLLPVCAMPADTDLRNYVTPMKGNYEITGSAIVFTPDTAFKSGQTYFARYYRYDESVSATDLVLHHREPGLGKYTELIFKY